MTECPKCKSMDLRLMVHTNEKYHNMTMCISCGFADIEPHLGIKTDWDIEMPEQENA